MPPISNKKKEKISEQIIHYLFSISPESRFTSHIAKEIARDEEFTKHILLSLQKSNVVTPITKNPLGINYKIRQRWTLTSSAYNIYKQKQ